MWCCLHLYNLPIGILVFFLCSYYKSHLLISTDSFAFMQDIFRLRSRNFTSTSYHPPLPLIPGRSFPAESHAISLTRGISYLRFLLIEFAVASHQLLPLSKICQESVVTYQLLSRLPFFKLNSLFEVRCSSTITYFIQEIPLEIQQFHGLCLNQLHFRMINLLLRKNFHSTPAYHLFC